VSATRINHVSIPCTDLEGTARFYVELLGAVEIPTARFQSPVKWLAIGGQQLHLFESGTAPSVGQHFGFDVDDFEAVYRRAGELGAYDTTAFGVHLRHHPTGWVQLYLRDPAGNLIEANWPDLATLSPELRAESSSLADQAPQEGEAAVATLFHGAA
jgi:catechol 2,3-dioxygenase-like lactoylglutathione lyase family enzyme